MIFLCHYKKIWKKKNQIQLGFVCLMKDLRRKILEKNDK